MVVAPLDSVCTRISSGGTPSRKDSSYFSNDQSGHLWVKSKELLDRAIEDTEEHITDSGLANSSAKYFPARTVLVAMYGANVGQLGWLRRPATVNQAICGLVVDELKADWRFVFYSLLMDRGDLTVQAQGAAQQNLNQDLIRQFCISFPSLPVQQRIAGILAAYDDLIENSQGRIKILESMARTLYREWFVYFRYPGHETVPLVSSTLGKIPQGWEVKNLKDVASVTYGFPFASKKFNTNGVGTPIIRIRDILNGTINTFTDEHADPKYFIKNEDILVGMDGDFHMCIWSSGHAFQNQRVAKFESNGEIGNYHLFLALEVPIQTWNKAIVGTTVAHLGDIHIKTIQFVLPPKEILTEASEILEPMSLQIIALKRQIQNLRATRDALLPRLLSGQIEVSSDYETGAS
jgi:type I restriction enzyme S subunit